MSYDLYVPTTILICLYCVSKKIFRYRLNIKVNDSTSVTRDVEKLNYHQFLTVLLFRQMIVKITKLTMYRMTIMQWVHKSLSLHPWYYPILNICTFTLKKEFSKLTVMVLEDWLYLETKNHVFSSWDMYVVHLRDRVSNRKLNCWITVYCDVANQWRPMDVLDVNHISGTAIFHPYLYKNDLNTHSYFTYTS